jgi:hypothetical protein
VHGALDMMRWASFVRAPAGGAWPVSGCQCPVRQHSWDLQ